MIREHLLLTLNLWQCISLKKSTSEAFLDFRVSQNKGGYIGHTKHNNSELYEQESTSKHV